MLKNKKAVIFDLDGTLVDSMWMWKGIDIEFLAKKGLAYPEDLEAKIEGMSFDETAEYFAKAFPIPETPEELKVIWNNMAREKYEKKVPFKPGALKFLQYLKANGIRTGIATSNSRELLNAVATAHDLYSYIEVFQTSDEVKKGKPAPDVFLSAAKHLKVDPADCLVFEDITNGILAGKNAGMTVCAVADQYSEDLIDTKKKLADFYITSYEQVLDHSYEDLRNE